MGLTTAFGVGVTVGSCVAVGFVGEGNIRTVGQGNPRTVGCGNGVGISTGNPVIGATFSLYNLTVSDSGPPARSTQLGIIVEVATSLI